MKQGITLIIPAYNEEKIIRQTAEEALSALSEVATRFELIVVDDGSTDGMIEALKPLDGLLRVVSYAKNRGKGYAICRGMEQAQYELVFYTDADLAYGLSVLSEAVALFEKPGVDAVLGSRILDGQGYAHYPPLRKLASRVFHGMTSAVSGLSCDSQCGFKGFRREAGQKVFRELETERFAFDVEALLLFQKFGYTYEEMPVRIINHRESKIHVIKDSVRMFRDMLKIRRSVNRRFP